MRIRLKAIQTWIYARAVETQRRSSKTRHQVGRAMIICTHVEGLLSKLSEELAIECACNEVSETDGLMVKVMAKVVRSSV